MKYILGVEITKEQLKLVLVNHSGFKVKNAKCFVESISGVHDEVIVEKIINFIQLTHLKCRDSIISLSRNFVTVRNLHLPSKDNEEIANMIDLHISRIVPFKRDEVYINYNISGSDEMGYSRITLAIVHDEIVKRQLRILDKAGLLVDKVALGSYSIWQWIIKSGNKYIDSAELFVILDIDEVFTDFIIASKGNVIFTRSIAVNAIELNNDDGRKKFLGEVRQSLMIFYNEEMNKKPTVIFVRDKVDSALKDLLKKELDIDVVAINMPLILQSSGDGYLPPQVSFIAVSSAVAYSGNDKLSFIIPELQIKRELRRKIKDFIVFGAVVMYLFALSGLMLWSKTYKRGIYLNKLQKRITEIKTNIGEVGEYFNVIDLVKDQFHSRKIPIYLLYTLQKIMPAAVSIDSLDVKDGKVALRGRASELSYIFEFEAALKKIPHFKEVYSRDTRKQKINDKDVVMYEIVFSLMTDKK